MELLVGVALWTLRLAGALNWARESRGTKWAEPTARLAEARQAKSPGVGQVAEAGPTKVRQTRSDSAARGLAWLPGESSQVQDWVGHPQVDLAGRSRHGSCCMHFCNQSFLGTETGRFLQERRCRNFPLHPVGLNCWEMTGRRTARRTD